MLCTIASFFKFNVKKHVQFLVEWALGSDFQVSSPKCPLPGV